MLLLSNTDIEANKIKKHKKIVGFCSGYENIIQIRIEPNAYLQIDSKDLYGSIFKLTESLKFRSLYINI